MKFKPAPRGGRRVSRSVETYRPRLELLESKLLPGETFWLGLWALSLTRPVAELLSASLEAGRGDTESALHRRLVAMPDTAGADSTLPVWTAPASREAQRDQDAAVRVQPPAGGGAADVLDEIMALSATGNQTSISHGSMWKAPRRGAAEDAAVIGATSGRAEALSMAALSRTEGQAPDSSPPSASILPAAPRLAPDSVTFDPWTGEVAIRGDGADNTIQEALTPRGYVNVTLDGLHHSSDPASADFDLHLAGATAARLTGIHLDGDGGQDTLILGSQRLAGSLNVTAAGAEVVTEDVTVRGLMTVQAANVTVRETLRGSTITLDATAWVSVEGTGAVVARQGDYGGRIAVVADKISNTGQLGADGQTGGRIDVQARNILNAGSITADGTRGPGGTVSIAFAGAYIDTVAALTTANGGGSGHGGHVVLNGGATGRLFSSGRQQAMGGLGGSVSLLGREIVLDGGAVDASGESGGGSIRVGGDFQGRNPAVVNADTVTVTPAATLRADARKSGDGGRVAVWSAAETEFQGAVSARGGIASGSGGSIEVSGLGSLTYGGTANADAVLGRNGTLLLDPKNIVISAAPVGVFPQFELFDPHPTAGGGFGSTVTVLSNGNVVVINPHDDFGGTEAGAAYLFDGSNGALLSSLVGGSPNDRVGIPGVTPLSNGNYVIRSEIWNSNRGAVTWGGGRTGVSGVVSAANSLVGSNPDDNVGEYGVTALSNGNYLMQDSDWNDRRGAVTWGDGRTGVTGVLSAANSLVGSSPNDLVGYSVTLLSNGNYLAATPRWNANRGAVTWGDGGIGVRGAVSDVNSLVGTNPGDGVGSTLTRLSNSNYLVGSPGWDSSRGAATWGNGGTGVRGAVSETNSLVGSNPNDLVGYSVTLLSSGNYLVFGPSWDNGRGAVTWADGSAGVHGIVSETNSLVGSSPNDAVGGHGVTLLSNGNYLVLSPGWNGGRGAVTWADGSRGITGTISESNSLVGSNADDEVGGESVTLLSNGNYLVKSPFWSSSRGAVTWGDANTGARGIVSEANSLVGSNPNDGVGNAYNGVTRLSNGNYLVLSPHWNVGRGAVTWGDGSNGVDGIVSQANSLVGSNPDDADNSYVVPLSNGNYLVGNPSWNGRRGAVTWGDGRTGTDGIITGVNSFVGANPNDLVGTGVLPLSNGNYVIGSPLWGGNRGAATWGDGATGIDGTVSEANSLIGSKPGDEVGVVTALSNGNYLVESPSWNGYRGAVTWGDGTTGVRGAVSDTNSLVGRSPSDWVGCAIASSYCFSRDVILLSNGNYLVGSPLWSSQSGAVTWGDGRTGVRGLVSETNSLVGSSAYDRVGYILTPLSHGDYLVQSPSWNGGRGAATWGDGDAGVQGTISEANSLIGLNPGDSVGYALARLSNGNYLVQSPSWNGGRGAVTWGDGGTGIRGSVSEANSLVGSSPNDRVGDVALLGNGNYLIQSPSWNGGRGAVTWADGTTGQTLDGKGIVTPQNSILGQAANAGLGSIVTAPIHESILARFVSDGGGRVVVGLTDPNQFNYSRAQSQTVTLTPDFLTATLNTGTAIVLQASNNITIEDPITVNASGHGGALTLQAGRSILLNADITTDNGPLTLIANDTRADGVIDSQRDSGNAVIIMAGGTTLDTGTAPLDIELRDGSGLPHADSRAINLQTLIAGSISIVNDGPDPGSDIRLGPVSTTGPQSYSNPNGTTLVTGGLSSGDYPITFTDSVAVGDGVSVDAGSGTVSFAGDGTQTLQSGDGAILSSLNHTGGGVLQLTSGLAVAGTLLQGAGTFDANDQPVTVGGAAVLTGGIYLAGTAPQTFAGGLILTDGTFTSFTGPMSISGDVTLTGGTFGGVGTVDSLTVYRGTVAPGTTDPGVLAVANAVRLTPLSTFSALVNGLDPGSGYAQLTAGGPLDLGGSTLDLALGFAPPPGSSFAILTTADAAGVRGSFAGLPEGAVFSQDGYEFQITYRGGDKGNSVVLTCLAAPSARL